MTWARFDDRFDTHRKVMRAWKLNRAAVGLYVMSITHSSGHELDGHVDPEFVESKLPKPGERKKAVDALLQAGLWEPNGDGWVVHDFLDHNPSAEEIRARRQAEADRKAKARADAARSMSERSPA